MPTQNTAARWFCAWLVFESQIDDPGYDTPLREDRVVLFKTTDLESAKTAATHYARNEEHSYKNEAGERVRWRLVEVEDVQEIDDDLSAEGWEVASRHYRRAKAVN